MFHYLLSRDINGNRFVQYSGVCVYVALASITLTLAPGRAGAINVEGAAVPAICTIPIGLGTWVGQRQRLCGGRDHAVATAARRVTRRAGISVTARHQVAVAPPFRTAIPCDGRPREL